MRKNAFKLIFWVNSYFIPQKSPFLANISTFQKSTFRAFLGALSFTTARRGATIDMRVLTNRAVYSKLY